VYVNGDGPYYQWVVDRCRALGIPVGSSFNTDFDAQLARAVGHTLVIAVVGDRLVLPERYWPAQTVISADHLRQREGENVRGVITRQRDDGTLVYVLFGRDEVALHRTVDEFSP
jgi:hypothetical protein